MKTAKSLLDNASSGLWNLCMNTAVDDFNGELSDKAIAARIVKFTRLLERFGKAYQQKKGGVK